MHFLIKDENFLEKYNEIWEKVSNVIEKKLNSEPVHNKKYLKAVKKCKKKSFNVILIDSVCRKDENYYPKVFLEKR